MVKAELSYNPYITETLIRFNGQAPRINSQVEKYQKSSLQSWIKKVPIIFYNEMNGYDFELEFSGTALDFEELKKSFHEAKVSETQVKLFHKYVLDDRMVTLEQLRSLLVWLDANPNRKFDLDGFKNNNVDLFDESYPYVLLHGRGVDVPVFSGLPVSVDYIDRAVELNDTALKSIPILVLITAESLPSLATDLAYFRNRIDVMDDQLFFLIDSALERGSVKRVITDLGITKPCIVESTMDERIRGYLEQYSVTDYICDSIVQLRGATAILAEELESENRESLITNQGIHDQIGVLDNRIANLKESLELFINRENLDIPLVWMNEKTNLIQRLNNWKIRKTTITKDDEAYASAQELEREIHQALVAYISGMTNEVEKTKGKLKENFELWYSISLYADEYHYMAQEREFVAPEISPSVWEHLLSMKTEQYVVPKEDIFVKFFKTIPEEPKEPVLEKTYHIQEWREYASSVVAPIAEQFQMDMFDRICTIYQNTADEYIQHLNVLIDQETKDKEQVSSQLSEDEKLLQMDNDWLKQFAEQLKEIERR